MSRILLERYLNTPYLTPMNYDLWMELSHRLDSCLETRNVNWLRSFVSVDGHYSLCEFEGPYAEAVREACREAGVSFKQVWRAELLTEAESETFIPQELSFLVEVNYDFPMTQDNWNLDRDNTLFCFKEHGIQKLITWMSPDHLRSIYWFRAANSEDIRTAFRQTNIPFQHLWKCYLISNI